MRESTCTDRVTACKIYFNHWWRARFFSQWMIKLLIPFRVTTVVFIKNVFTTLQAFLLLGLYYRQGRYAPCPLDLCHSIGLLFWPFGPQLGLRSWSRPAASFFGLRPQYSTLRAQLGLRPRSPPAAVIFGPSGFNSIQVTQQHFGSSSMCCCADDASP